MCLYKWQGPATVLQTLVRSYIHVEVKHLKEPIQQLGCSDRCIWPNGFIKGDSFNLFQQLNHLFSAIAQTVIYTYAHFKTISGTTLSYTTLEITTFYKSAMRLSTNLCEFLVLFSLQMLQWNTLDIVFPTLCQQFMEEHLLFQHCGVLIVHKNWLHTCSCGWTGAIPCRQNLGDWNQKSGSC